MTNKKGLFQYNEKIFCKDDVVHTLKSIGIEHGDVVFVHSNLGVFGRLADIKDRKEYNSEFLNACLEAVGDKGTLVVPTFTYSFCNCKIFDVEKSPSTLNYFTEVARKTNGFVRSDDPIFSVVAKGPAANDLINNLSTCCLGKNSIWERLYQKNAHNLMLGTKFDSTFLHYIEEYFRVPYRYDKVFSGKIKNGGKIYKKSYTYYVRDLKLNPEPFLEELYQKSLENKVLKKIILGAGTIMTIRSKDLFSITGKMLKKNLYSLVKISNLP